MKGGCCCAACRLVRGGLREVERELRASLKFGVPDDHQQDYRDALGAVEAILEKDTRDGVRE